MMASEVLRVANDMNGTRHADRRGRRLAMAAIVLEVLLALGAIGGGIALILGPRGEIIPLPVSALSGSPFDSYLIPGVILLTVLGLGPLVAAIAAWRANPLAPLMAVAVGGGLLVWLAVQIVIIGFSTSPPLQPIYLVLGLVIVAVGVTWELEGRQRPNLRGR